MNILVTGGLGVVGRPLVERLVNHNHRLRVLDTASADVPAGVEFAAADVTDFAAVREAVRDIHAVIHLAAIPNPAGAAASSGRDPDDRRVPPHGGAVCTNDAYGGLINPQP